MNVPLNSRRRRRYATQEIEAMDQLTDWAVRNHIGDLASVVGVLKSIVGFAVTIWNVSRSKRAARRAEEAVLEVKRGLNLFNTAVDIAAAMAIMEEIRRLHREGAWPVLPDRYSTLKRHLTTIRKTEISLDDAHRRAILLAIQNLTGMEQEAERAIARDSPMNVPKLNRLVSKDIDRLHEVLIDVRNRIGGRNVQ
jgi:hypothetical protein